MSLFVLRHQIGVCDGPGGAALRGMDRVSTGGAGTLRHAGSDVVGMAMVLRSCGRM